MQAKVGLNNVKEVASHFLGPRVCANSLSHPSTIRVKPDISNGDRGASVTDVSLPVRKLL